MVRREGAPGVLNGGTFSSISCDVPLVEHLPASASAKREN